MSCFGQEFSSQCQSKVDSDKMETLKTNLLFSNPFAAENKKMTIVFVPQDPKESKETKIKCIGPKMSKKALIKFDVSIFGWITFTTLFGSISGQKETKHFSIINYRSYKISNDIFIWTKDILDDKKMLEMFPMVKRGIGDFQQVSAETDPETDPRKVPAEFSTVKAIPV